MKTSLSLYLSLVAVIVMAVSIIGLSSNLPAYGAATTGYIQVKCPPNVQIFLDGTMQGVSTSEIGGIIIQNVSPGQHQIMAVREGFTPKTVSINVTAGNVAVCEIGTLSPKIKVEQTGKSSETEIQQKVGSLKIQTLPIDCKIEIRDLIKDNKSKDEWKIPEIPVGKYEASFSALGKTIKYSIVIDEGITRHLMVNFLEDTVKDLSTATVLLPTGSVTDIDGNVYQTVEIGNQIWTVENLRTTRFNDGTPIPLVTDNAAWEKLTTPGYCWYDNNIKNKSKYGALYNWFTVGTKKLAPKGWHVPTDADWDTLQNYLIANGYNWDGTTTNNMIGKSLAAKTDWQASTKIGAIGNDLTKNNKSGFSALPSYRENDGSYGIFGDKGFWWSASEYSATRAYYRNLSSYWDSLNGSCCFKSFGFSVRLVRDSN